MAVKLSSLAFSKRFPIWVISSSCFSSISCANPVETFPGSNRDEFEQNFQFLRNELVPDNLIRVLDNTNDLSSALKLFKWASLQKRFFHTKETYFRIILKLGMAGNLQEMEGFCQNMIRDRVPGVGEALASLIDTFVENGRLSEALLVLDSMNSNGFNVSIETFNAVMGSLVEVKRDFRDVLFVYKEMVKAGTLPNVETLNCLLEALFEIDRVKSALDQFKRMAKKGCNPNSRSYEIVLSGLIAKQRVDEAVVLLYEMFESGCQPDLSFYSCVIPLLCQENRPKEGIRLLKMMKDSNFVPDLAIYTVLIECLCENLWLDEAICLIEEIIGTGLMLPNNVLVDVINMFWKLGKVDEAVKFIEDKNVLETSPHNALLEACCCAGKFVRAKDLIRKMSKSNIDDRESWNILLRWVCEQEGIKKASGLLGRMFVSSFVPDCDTYSALVVGNCKLSRFIDALEIFNRIQAKSWVLDSISYSKLVEGLCSVGQIREAAEVFRYMSKNGCQLQSSSFDMLIESICSEGKVSEAIRLRQLAYSSSTLCTSTTYTTIMHGLSKVDREKEILLVLSQMLVCGCGLEVETYCILIQSMSVQNRVKDCVLLFNRMVNEGLVPDSRRLFDVLSCMANHSQLCTISRSIHKLISRDVMDSSVYNLLINGLWKEGNRREAGRLLDLMLEKGWVPDAKTHALLIGSSVREEVDREESLYGSSTDSVSNILAEGLEIT
ncbi:hypothetical protein UlMin_015176 [Ulmus minor]